MSDLPARLRNPMWGTYPAHGSGFVPLATEQVVADMNEAADEIERLRADKDRLERGVARIRDYLNEIPPRDGDASFDAEALLAGSVYR